jgi:hypothetical protein
MWWMRAPAACNFDRTVSNASFGRWETQWSGYFKKGTGMYFMFKLKN